MPRDARLAVLDVGAGYGAVTEELLRLFPAAEVTLQDYSTPMLAEARRRLAAHAGQLRVVTADLTDPAWPAAVGGPFDLAVSAIVLHNLRDDAKIFACYRAIHDLLRPGGWFLDYDLFFDGVEQPSARRCARPGSRPSSAAGRREPARHGRCGKGEPGSGQRAHSPSPRPSPRKRGEGGDRQAAQIRPSPRGAGVTG